VYGIEVERRNFVLGVLARSIGTGETDPNPGKDLIAVIAWGVKSYPAACRQNFQSDINTIVDYAQIFGLRAYSIVHEDSCVTDCSSRKVSTEVEIIHAYAERWRESSRPQDPTGFVVDLNRSIGT